MDRIETRRLACGMTLIVEPVDGVRSAALTWLVPAGTASEPVDRRGLCAMWTELLLRGAGELGSREQADALDRLGVSRGTDAGPYHVRVSATMVGDRLGASLPLLVDMVRRPRFDEASIGPAKDLALQALESLKDNPQERALIAARARHLPEPLGRSALGTAEGLAAISRGDITGRWSALARPGRSILAVAGAVDGDAVAGELDRLLSGWEGTAPQFEMGGGPARGYEHEVDQSNQVQIVVLCDAPAEPSPTSILEKVVTATLSGGMSGRLFTEVREKRGLCYSVSASYASGREYGTVTAYVGTTPERAQESLDVLVAELSRINADGIEKDEFDRAIIGMKSRLVFAGESTGARAASAAADMHRVGRARGLAELTRAIDAVTLDEVNAYLKTRSLGRMTVQTVGPAALKPPT